MAAVPRLGPLARDAGRWRWPIVAAALFLQACATAPGLPSADDPRLLALPASAALEDVPFFPQDDYYCGPAALAMVLAWSGLAVDQDDLVPLVYTPERRGTLQSDILAGARRMGRLAVEVRTLPDLMAELAAGNPVLVFQNLGLAAWPQWHYAVATGYDRERGVLRLHSGRTADLETRLATFARTWARADNWALVVLEPGRLPATGGERAVLEAAAALERAEQPSAAHRAYAAILGRWPDSLPGWIGLGNAAYATGDLDQALAAFREATERHPDAAAAWQNLSVVLEERGDSRAAADAAARAEAIRTAPAG